MGDFFRYEILEKDSSVNVLVTFCPSLPIHLGLSSECHRLGIEACHCYPGLKGVIGCIPFLFKKEEMVGEVGT